MEADGGEWSIERQDGFQRYPRGSVPGGTTQKRLMYGVGGVLAQQPGGHFELAVYNHAHAHVMAAVVWMGTAKRLRRRARARGAAVRALAAKNAPMALKHGFKRANS